MKCKRGLSAASLIVTALFLFGNATGAWGQGLGRGPGTTGKPDKVGKEDRPPKVFWSPTRVQNEHVEAGQITVELSADKEVVGANLWPSGSLSGFLLLPPGPIDIPEGGSVQVNFELLQTPDEAGRTLGGTVHLVWDGKHLAQPLPFSLKKSETSSGDTEPEEEIVDEDGTLPVSWYVGDEPLDEVTLDLFENGVAEVVLKANRTLTNILLWLTPSLRDCIAVSLAADIVPEEGVLELTGDGKIALIAEGVQVTVVVELLKPLDEITSNIGGTLHARNIGVPPRTWPATLPFNIVVDEESEQTEEVTPAAVVDAASFEERAVAAGQIVSVFGLGLGEEELAVFGLDEEGKVEEYLNGTMVLFDGYAARLLSANAGQVNAIVPAAVKGSAAELIVIHKGKQSTPFPVPVGPVAPSLFTLGGTGRGQAAALNQEDTRNGNQTPARAGTVISLFGTGTGPTDPPLADGEIASRAISLANQIRVFVGGREADVLYAGAAPKLVGAVVQINVRLHGGTPKGPQPVLLVAEGVESSAAVTVAVR